MIAKAYAPATFGLDGRLIEIECDMTQGLPGFVVVGLGDKAVDEARERVRSAIRNSGLTLPPKRLTLNLAPADLPKDGSGYDLGMAVAILAASGQLPPERLRDCLFLGELALDGAVRPVKGALLAAQVRATRQLRHLFIATDNAAEASLIGAGNIIPVSHLRQVYEQLLGQAPIVPLATVRPDHPATAQAPAIDLAQVYGQDRAKRAIEIAAAGGHNILLSGPPGTGKSLLSKAILGLLPPLTHAEMIEVTKLHSLGGQTLPGIIHHRPFRAPHHSASSVALVGGGTHPRPGEISLSHHGVLLLDELPEFPRSVLEVLRQPLEDGAITIARAGGIITFPANFMLVATQNPCPCGYAGDPDQTCNCTAAAISNYRRRISGPLLDRIDLVVEVTRNDQSAVITASPGEPTATVAARVAAARHRQTTRLATTPAHTNSQMTNEMVEQYCKINNDTAQIAHDAMAHLHLSSRAYLRTLKVARTIADLAASPTIELHHFAEALQYRAPTTLPG